LNLKTTAKELIFSCENSVEEKKEEPPGIGLENLRRRMELRFPNQHKIQLQELPNGFIASLKIDI